ncbi:MAG: MSMEG_0568 family radical SAM protein [Candidatus Sifarchaeia archaeon]
MNYSTLKTELLCLGAKAKTKRHLRKTGAGPAGGSYFILPNGSIVQIPVVGRFVQNSPFSITEVSDVLHLYKNDERVCNLQGVPTPEFYQMSTSDGTPMWKIALIHGVDCLATTVDQTCVHWRHNLQCDFCGIELSLKHHRTVKRKSPEQLIEVIHAARAEERANHVTLTIGTQPGADRGASVLLETTRSIKEQIDIPIHVQVEPVDETYLLKLKDSGVDTLGIHIETCDPDIFRKVCPGKALLDFEYYEKMWGHAVDIFGKNQVSSFVIIGLGESDESILNGAKWMTSNGVIPFVVPLRPIPETPLENAMPPSPERMVYLYDEVNRILKENDLNPNKNKAGCVRCKACSPFEELVIGY